MILVWSNVEISEESFRQTKGTFTWWKSLSQCRRKRSGMGQWFSRARVSHQVGPGGTISRLASRIFLRVLRFSFLYKKPISPNSNSNRTRAPAWKLVKADVASSLNILNIHTFVSHRWAELVQLLLEQLFLILTTPWRTSDIKNVPMVICCSFSLICTRYVTCQSH